MSRVPSLRNLNSSKAERSGIVEPWERLKGAFFRGPLPKGQTRAAACRPAA